MGRSGLPLPLLALFMALTALPAMCSGQVQLSYTSTLLPGVGNATCGWYTMQFTTWCNASAQTYITAHDVRGEEGGEGGGEERGGQERRGEERRGDGTGGALCIALLGAMLLLRRTQLRMM